MGFSECDFSDASLLPAASFDLLLALSAGKVAETCGYALRPGGYVLADDLLKDAHELFALANYKLAGRIILHRDKYEFKPAPALPAGSEDKTAGKEPAWHLFQKTA